MVPHPFYQSSPKPVYEALLGTLYSDLVFREGSEWKFGTGTRNVNRNEPHGFRFLYWRDAIRRHRDPRRRGKASARAIVAAVHAAYEIFEQSHASLRINQALPRVNSF